VVYRTYEHNLLQLTVDRRAQMTVGFRCVIAFIIAVAPGVCRADAAVSLRGLLDEMTNLDQLAQRARYVTRLASSYNRDSTTPDKASWFANRDFGQFVREEVNGGRRESVMLDVDGPGALVRLWSANPQGTLRIYLDGAAAPALEVPMEELLAGRSPLFPPPFAHIAARGYNLYFPIPFARHCKVTVDAPKRLYYHVNYRQYPRGTRVETFTRAGAVALADAIKQTAARLDSPAPTGKGEWKRGAPPSVRRRAAGRRGHPRAGGARAKGRGRPAAQPARHSLRQ
jgi:hypothetical protein